MKIFKKIIICLILIMLVSSCTSIKHYVSYTIYPIGYILNRVGGDRITTMSIQNDAMVELSSAKEDIKDIIDDSLYLFYIDGLEPYYDMYRDAIKKSRVTTIDLSELNAIYKFQRYTLVYTNDGDSYIESPYYDSPLFDEIDSYDYDLFLWLDPIGMLSMAKDVYEVLSSNYSEQASYFKENYDKLYDELIVLDAAYHNLANNNRKNNKTIKFVSMTPSFGSWQKSYGFNVYPLCLSRYGTLPNEEQLLVIEERIKKDNVRYIAYEPNMNEGMIALFDRVSSDLGLTRINLSNISSLVDSQEGDSKDYMTLMYENLMVLENITEDINSSSESVEEKVQEVFQDVVQEVSQDTAEQNSSDMQTQ